MALEKPFPPEKDALENAMLFDGLLCVRGTAGIEAALPPDERGEDELVEPDPEQSGFFHRSRFFSKIFLTAKR